MKNVTVSCCILLVCSLFACRKNNEMVQPLPPSGGVDSTIATIPAPIPPKYVPGDTLIVTGDTSNGDETVLLFSGLGYDNIAMPNYNAIGVIAKGFGNIQGKARSILKFRLRHIDDSFRDNPPPIKKAVLYLYQYSVRTDQDPYIRQQNGNNAIELHRIIGDWQDATVSWNTQPNLATGSVNALEDVVTIPAVTTPLAAGTTDDQQIDITDIMRKIFESHDNKGFLLKMAEESANCGRSYGSFSCPDQGKRPKLVIYF